MVRITRSRLSNAVEQQQAIASDSTDNDSIINSDLESCFELTSAGSESDDDFVTMEAKTPEGFNKHHSINKKIRLDSIDSHLSMRLGGKTHRVDGDCDATSDCVASTTATQLPLIPQSDDVLTMAANLLLDQDSDDSSAFELLVPSIGSSQSKKGSQCSNSTKRILKKAKTDALPRILSRHIVESEDSTVEEEASDTENIIPKVKKPASKKSKATTVYDFHPELASVWDSLREEISAMAPGVIQQPPDLKVKLFNFQLQGVNWMVQQERSEYHGGILADEMGLGKTIQTISLMLTDNTVTPNLIVCPNVAMNQWKHEIENRVSPGIFTVCIFHGSSRTDSIKELLKYNVIITSYAIVEQGFRKQHYGVKRKGELVKQKSLLHSIEWARCILDEAHMIKDRSCSTARAVFALQRQRQWSLTGSPLQNRVGELFSLIRFLNADPFSYYFCNQCDCKSVTWNFKNSAYCEDCGHTGHRHFCYWNKEILKPIQNFGPVGDGLIAFQKLGTLLDRIMLRRSKDNHLEEIGLPPRVVTVRKDTFNRAEEELYDSLYSDTVSTFNTYVRAGTVLNNYASIFSLLSRMRLASNHPLLVTAKLNMQSKEGHERMVCVICQDEAEDPITSKCKHVFCREDAVQFLQSSPDNVKCPKCFKPLSIDLFQPEATLDDVSSSKPNDTNKSIVNYIDFNTWRSSTKIEALIEELTKLRCEDRTTKSIVFSQFTAFLDLVHWRLLRAGYQVVKLDGRMRPDQRSWVINKFNTDPEITVFLISLKAGGVALNLTEASQVFMLDPWWNPAAENQAFDRVHRIGQKRPIKVTRLIIENSIESRIIELQEKKKHLFDSTVGKSMDSLAKLSEDDLRFLFVL